MDNHIDGLFFPYYINQARLLDLYAILNKGFSEYEEVNSSASQEKKKSGKAHAEASSGFHIFKLGGSIDGSLASETQKQDSVTIRRVHTTTSILSIVIRALYEKRYVHDILDAQEGSFVIVPVRLRINSIKSLLKEAEELVELGGKMQLLGEENTKIGKPKSKELQQIKNISDVVRELFNAEEIVYETNKYAIVGNISDDHLYQATRSDIIDVKLNCLAQVKRKYAEGTQLMKNTVFTKLQDSTSKAKLINDIKQIASGSNFKYESEAIPEIVDKPVIQLEIVALYQKSEPKVPE